MRTFVIVFGLLATTSALAGGRCDTQVDPFSNKVTTTARGPYLEQGWSAPSTSLQLGVEGTDEGTTATIKFIISAAVHDSLPSGFPIHVLLQDGLVVDLTTVVATTGAMQVMGLSVQTTFNARFPVSEGQLRAMSQGTSVHIKYIIGGHEVNHRVRPGFAKRFQKAFGCIADS
ncbi:MAG: hypothetical protein ACJAZO_003703 [Myxococcota bacterium]|jgi:hypothetical protein